MRIVILGHYEIASNYAISLVVNHLYKNHDINIMLSGRGDVYENSSSTFEKDSFAALAHYEQSLCDDLNAGINSLQLECDSFDVLAKKTKHNIETLSKPNSKSGLKRIRALDPELIISIRFRKYLKEDLIAIPKHGVINLHSGRLPEYRGAMATFWSMLNNETQIGSVLHYISDAEVDTGDVIAASTLECDYSRSYLSNVLGLYPLGAQNIISTVLRLAQGKSINSSPQPHIGKYYSFPSDDNRKDFLALGHALFDTL